ncbi:hypothetical protein [Streptacidiphilus jiangxiensis]|uniref:Uncharacterized protein n=1 Tax=Streptacidiphilus jiangxiensis TaxID=235985 RepID=A0A1H7MBS3_STRJI|nr:hypothetical protein [Streptacidiphilus jiangxiensis]SEL08633.1 hypothetical protein SAMN05414137_105291 [Streptacidiphilus jiangxiensis]
METLTDRDFYPDWHDALDLLNRDLAASEPGVEPFALLLNEYGVYVGFPSWGAQGNALPEQPEAGLHQIADAAQESAMEFLWRTWPVCPEHGLGVHPRSEGEQVLWWCAGRGVGEGHGTPVGTFEARRTMSRRASKRRQGKVSRDPDLR